MSSSPTMLPMSDGNDIPQIFGSAFRLGSTEETKAHVHALYNAGVRHFEISELHGNGHTVTEALRECTDIRSDIYITLKVWPKSRNPTDVIETVSYFLKSFQINYIDVLMMHAPIDVENKIEQYKALEELKDNGIAKSIGIVNLNAVLLQDLLKNCRIQPAVYECESHPFYQNDDMIEFCNDSSIIVFNNEPIAKGMRNDHNELQILAANENMSVVRLLLLYTYTRGLCVGISTNPLVMNEIHGNNSVHKCFGDNKLSPKHL